MDLGRSGRLLSDLRKAKGLTQKQIAEGLGVMPKTVSKWETGHGFPDVSTVSALADILKVSEKTILTGILETNIIVKTNKVARPSPQKSAATKIKTIIKISSKILTRGSAL